MTSAALTAFGVDTGSKNRGMPENFFAAYSMVSLSRFPSIAMTLAAGKRPGVAIENIGKYVFYHIHITDCKLHIVFII